MRGNKIMGFIWVIIAVVLVLILIGGLSHKNSGFKWLPDFSKSIEKGFSFGDANLYSTKTYTTDMIDSMDIDVSNESIYIQKSPDSKIILELYCTEDCEPKVNIINNVLKINDQYRKFSFLGQRKIVVKIPDGMEFDEIDLITQSGSIHFENVQLDSVDCKSSSGSIHIADCKFNSLDGKSTSGSVHINNSSISELECKSTSGSVKIEGSFDYARLQSVSGSIHADLKKPLTMDSEMQSTSGSIKLNTPANSNMKIIYSVLSGTYKNEISGCSGKKGTDIIGDGGPNIEMHSTSGSIHVNKK